MSGHNGPDPQDSGAPALEIDDLTVAYNSKPAIWDIDLRVPEGVLMAVIGPNGAGKSTLIKAALKLIPAPPAQFSSTASPMSRSAASSAMCRSAAA